MVSKSVSGTVKLQGFPGQKSGFAEHIEMQSAESRSSTCSIFRLNPRTFNCPSVLNPVSYRRVIRYSPLSSIMESTFNGR